MSIQIHSLKNFFRSSMALLFDPVKKQLVIGNTPETEEVEGLTQKKKTTRTHARPQKP